MTPTAKEQKMKKCDLKEWAGKIGAAMTFGGFPAVVKQLTELRKELFEDAAFNLWRNGPPIYSDKTSRAKDRRYALDYLRKLAKGE